MLKHKSQNKQSPRQWLKRLFVQPSDAFYQKPAIYMSGNELELQNFRAVIDYTTDTLLIDLGRGYLRIEGDNLMLLALEKSHLILQGYILHLSFSDE